MTEQWQRPDGGSGPTGPARKGWGEPSPGPAAAPGGHRPPPVAPRPGIVPLRPLGLGEIWDGAFRAFRQNPRVMVGLSAIVVVIISVVSLVASLVTTRDVMGAVNRLEAGGGSLDELFGSLQRSAPLWAFSTLLQSVAVLVLNGMLIVSVSRAVLGRTISFGELWATCRKRLLPLVALSVVITLSTAVVGVVGLAPGILLVVFSSSDVVTGVGVVALLVGLAGWAVGGAFLWVKWSMATPAMLLEELGVVAALKRSFGLTKRSFWRLFGILLLTAIVVYVVVMAVAVPFTGLGAVLGETVGSGDSGWGLVLSQTITTLGSVVGSIVGYPFLASVTALLYVDLRMRREGLDVELHRAVTP